MALLVSVVLMRSALGHLKGLSRIGENGVCFFPQMQLATMRCVCMYMNGSNLARMGISMNGDEPQYQTKPMDSSGAVSRRKKADLLILYNPSPQFMVRIELTG